MGLGHENFFGDALTRLGRIPAMAFFATLCGHINVNAHKKKSYNKLKYGR